jgi:D-inositol-3-phosphate glycosyltransferase
MASNLKENNQLRIMMVCGWDENPYVEYVVRALLRERLKVFLVIRKTLNVSIQDESLSVHRIFTETKIGRTSISKWIEKNFLSIFKWIKLLIEKKPDIVHFQEFRHVKLDWLFFLCLKLLRKKVVFTIHDTHPQKQSSIESINLLLKKKASIYCNALFVHSEYSKKIVQESWRMNDQKIFVVPHGGYGLHYGIPILQENARAKLGYHKSDFILLFFGQIRQWKGLDCLLLSLVEAKKSIPNLNLIIAGSDKHSMGDFYRKMISDLDLDHEVNFQNRFIKNEEVSELFCCCDITILPYTKIDQSGVLFLSYTFGKPVIATRVGGLPEMVKDGVTGYTVPPANIHVLTEKIIEAWRNRESLKEMGLNAQKLINEEYSWDRLAESTVETYRKISCS